MQILWLDSASPSSDWHDLSDWEGLGSLECVSVGWLIAEDKHSKTIAPHVAYPNEKENRKGCGIMVIPTGAILSIRRLLISGGKYASGRALLQRGRVRLQGRDRVQVALTRKRGAASLCPRALGGLGRPEWWPESIGAALEELDFNWAAWPSLPREAAAAKLSAARQSIQRVLADLAARREAYSSSEKCAQSPQFAEPQTARSVTNPRKGAL